MAYHYYYFFFKCLRSKAEATKTPRALFSFYVDACKNVYIVKENDLMFDQDFCSPLSNVMLRAR